MLLIEQIYEHNDIASDYVKCLACKRGRLCDKPAGEKVIAIAIRGDIPPKNHASDYPEMSEMRSEVPSGLPK